ncbi:MAG: hypothetical protein J6333_11665, partial [Planctomycetes bacterium]|nr:hypothetical protein [Planctomycetota bacterium]
MADSLRAAAEEALARLADSFVYRKLGICYDYFCPPESLPSPMLPHPKDVRQGLPNPMGLGSGMADCALNNALLCDAYALRLEIGCGTANDERLFDRLIGGIIRLGTIAPRNAVIRGLSPDGKSFYPQCGPLPVIHWAHSAWRAGTTPTVACESQFKIRNIVQHWMENLEQNAFKILNHDDAFNQGGWLSGVARPALLAMAGALTGNAKWKEQAEATLDVASAASCPAASPGDAEALFALQEALDLLRHALSPRTAPRNAPEDANEAPAPAGTAHLTAIEVAMNQVAQTAAPLLKWHESFHPETLDEKPSLDWHEIKEDGALPWPRLTHEAQAAAAPALAAVAILLAPDAKVVQAQANGLRRFLAAIPWGRLWLGRALAPVALAHALGVEKGLWDEDLKERQPSFDGTASLVERFLDPAYDDANPGKTGHSTPAPRKEITVLYGHGGAPEKRKSHGHGHGHGKGNRPTPGMGGGPSAPAPVAAATP